VGGDELAHGSDEPSCPPAIVVVRLPMRSIVIVTVSPGASGICQLRRRLRGGAGEDDVARLQGQQGAEKCDEPRDREDELSGRRALPEDAVDHPVVMPSAAMATAVRRLSAALAQAA